MKRLTVLALSAILAASVYFAAMVPASARAADTAIGGEASCSTDVTFLGIPAWYKYLEVASITPTDKNGAPTGDPICQVVGPCVWLEGNTGGGEPGKSTDQCAPNQTRIDIPRVVQRVAIVVLDMLLRIAGIVAFGFLVYSGFRFVLSGGDSNKAKVARETAFNAAIGLGIAIVATGIVSFIGRSISN